MPFPISNRRKYIEITAVLLTAGGKFLFMDYLDWKLPFILVAIVCWSVYLIVRWRTDSNILRHWGFRLDNFKLLMSMLMPLALVAGVSFVIIGYLRHGLNLTWHILPILVVYPVWGTIQQFLCVGLVAGNLQEVNNRNLAKPAVVLITSILFALLHYPNIWLMVGTFVLALIYTAVYLKQRNLFALGLFHGWLGALFYYLVVGRDPWVEVFQRTGTF